MLDVEKSCIPGIHGDGKKKKHKERSYEENYNTMIRYKMLV